MAQAKNAPYSGPMTRNQLLALNQYVASSGFPTLGKWDWAQSSNVYVVKGTIARDDPVDLTVVCDLNSDNHFVQPQGNYNVNYMSTADLVGRKAKLLMTVQRPSSDPDLGADFVTAITRVVGLQAEVAKTPERKNLVVNGEQLRLSFYLFEPRSIYDEEEEEDGEIIPELTNETENISDTETLESDRSTMKQKQRVVGQSSSQNTVQETDDVYRVPYSYQSVWRDAEENYKNRIMTVYGPDRRVIPYILFPRFLKPGTTIIASFNLVHHAFTENRRTDKYLFDSYTANVTKIVILDLHDSVPKPLSTPRKRSGFVSQTPPSHATLKAAANTFLPIPSPSSPLPLPRNRSKKDKMPERNDDGDDALSQTAVGTSPENTGSAASSSTVSLPQVGSQPSSMAANLAAGALGGGGAIDDNLMRLLLPVIAEYYRSTVLAASSSTSEHTPSANEGIQSLSSPSRGGNVLTIGDANNPPSTSGTLSSVPCKRVPESGLSETGDISEDYVQVDGPEVGRTPQPPSTPAEDLGSSKDTQPLSDESHVRSSTERRESKRRR